MGRVQDVAKSSTVLPITKNCMAPCVRGAEVEEH